MTSTQEKRTDTAGDHLGLDDDGCDAESGSRVVLRADAVLAARGLRPRRVPILRAGSAASNACPREGYVELWRLPRPLAVRAAFATERAPRAVEGWFDHEVLTGDAHFDACVRVQSSAPDAMRALLASDTIRRRVGLLVARGGALRVSRKVVLVEVLSRDEADPAYDDSLGAAVVLALLDHAPVD